MSPVTQLNQGSQDHSSVCPGGPLPLRCAPARSAWPASATTGKQQQPAAGGRPRSGPRSTLDAFNSATDSPLLRSGSRGPAVARAQILLDRAWYSSGEIDGRFAANLQRMVKAYQAARGLKASGTVTPETWKRCAKTARRCSAKYTVTDKDLQARSRKRPPHMADRGRMKALAYETLEEALAEKFHTSVAYLNRSTPGKRGGRQRRSSCPAWRRGTPPAKGASIQIDKSRARALRAGCAASRPVAGFPISIGNEKNDPLPDRPMAIRNEVKNPSFTYNPRAAEECAQRRGEDGDRRRARTTRSAAIWLGLTKPHWGIHGTPNPANVGHSETNGCIHMTNWDVERLSTLAKAGFKVDVRQ